MQPFDPTSLPEGVRSRFVEGVNGLRMHILEAGGAAPGKPLALLLHGFPELAYSWRKVMGPLAAAGFHVVAPDQRGYGRTTGWSHAYDQDLKPFAPLSLVGDISALVAALGYHSVSLLVGHDFGSPVAAWCAMTRPDIFRAVVMMSAPFAGAPMVAAGHVGASRDAIDEGLATLPRPRKHYHWYYATRAADADMRQAPDGIAAFLRAYFHHKSADWPGNKPHTLRDWSASELAQMPTYYIMDRAQTMAETVSPHMPTAAHVARCGWLTETDLGVYASEYGRTGFQGGLNWYRTRFDAALTAELARFAGRTIDVPSLFVSGAQDWGTYQAPGALEQMQSAVCTAMRGCHLIDGAGHWVMQEQPEAVIVRLLAFASELSR
jgi:pimeloyl-ACP methyl ester carboxylesterase